MQTHNTLCGWLKSSCLALVLAGVFPQVLAQEIVEGVEIDGNIRFNGHSGATWDWAADASNTGCIITYPLMNPDCIGLPGSILVEDPSSAGGLTDPSIHEGGDKLNLPAAWNIISGNVPAKDDLGNLYAAKLLADGTGFATAGDTILFNALEREVNNGDSYFDFEFNARIISPDGKGGFQQCFDGVDFETGDPIPPNGALDPEECPDPVPGNANGGPGRSPGDFVLSYKLGTVTGSSKQISDVEIVLLEADANGNLDFINPVVSLHIDDTTMPNVMDLGDGEDLSGLINGVCATDPCPPNTLVVALNDKVIDAGPWGTVQKNANKLGPGKVDVANFAEIAWNLDNIGRGPSCPGTAYMTNKSKASSSNTADLKDTNRPVPFDLTNCGQITVKKETNPTGGTGFDFELDSTKLDIKKTKTLDDGGSHTFDLLEPGNYNLKELDPDTWSLTDISCVNDQDAPVSNIPTEDLVNRDIDIGLVANGAVTCTFKNERPKVTVKKLVTSCGVDPGAFDLFIGTSTTPVKAAAKNNDSGSAFVPIGPVGFSEKGATVSGETTLLTDYITKVAGTGCTEGDVTNATTRTGLTSTTSDGGDKSCDFINIRRAKVTLIKEFVPADDGGVVDLYIDSVKVGTADTTTDTNNDTVIDVTDRTFSALLKTLNSDNTAFTGPVVGENDGDLSNYDTWIRCDDSVATSQFFSADSGVARTVTLPDIPPGIEVTCRITNIRVAGAAACLN